MDFLAYTANRLHSVEATEAVSWQRADVMEVCCAADSRVTAVVEGLGGKGVRATLSTGIDLSRPEGAAAAKALWRKCRPRHMWISTPCGPFSVMQNANEGRSERTDERLRQNRRWSVKIIKHALELAEL
jgi:hypothetical protein